MYIPLIYKTEAEIMNFLRMKCIHNMNNVMKQRTADVLVKNDNKIRINLPF